MPSPVYEVSFERIGRHHEIPPLAVVTVTEFPADEVAEAVWRYAKSNRYLGSPDFVVHVNLETMTGSIEAGRFGRFTVAEVGETVAAT